MITLIVLSLFYAILCLIQKKYTKTLSRNYVICLIAAGIVIRLFYFTIETDILSDDVYRYYWDGKVQSQGINPYLYAPISDYFKAGIKDAFYEKVNHKEYKTIYPPLSQLFFFLIYSLGGNFFFYLKVLYLICDIICGFVLYKICKKKQHVLLYVLSPLLLVEVYLSMHIDIIGVLFLVCSIYFFKKQKYPLSFIFLGLSVLIKYITFGVFVIYVITLIHPKGSGIKEKPLTIFFSIFLFFMVIALFYAPYLATAGSGVFDQLFFYGNYWEFNSIIHPVISQLAPNVAFMIKACLYLIILGLLSFYKRMRIEHKVRLALLALLLNNGAFYPWYLLVLLPFLVLELTRADILLFFVIQISYIVIVTYKSTGVWEDLWITRAIEYIPFYIVLGYEFIKGHYVQKQENWSHNPGTQ
ncbi:MAG: hypothetical protein JXJ04_21380 [Spirochaetales bacterium]|nr:hypothetical protein [Spirochaetales bacterium]